MFNDEQMGEGWSDFFGLMMTIKPGDVGAQPTGVGTYVTNQSIDGIGIRPAPYSTDFALNNYTYAETNNSGLSMPHGIGFVWCSMLWDLNWALIDSVGFDPNLKTGTGGNNIAMALVIEGLKLTACNPGFVDGREAILQADELLYGGAHACTIWKVFARRGLGFSADQGDPMSRSDQTEAFDLPPSCLPGSGAGINEIENAFEVYPNPTNGKIEIKGETSLINSIELFALNGSRLSSYRDVNQVSLENLSNGIYLLKIGTENGVSIVRIVKN
jgi:extracellular elastinolytic metalloproteinase